MFNQIFVEHNYRSHPQVEFILSKFPNSEVKDIKKIEDVFGVVKKPYLQKRDNLNLFLGEKRGTLLKETPQAYGLSGEPHYYFIHAYNCIYECNYCYLQGYFHSPDIVLYLNHDDILKEIEATCLKHDNEPIWFHAGEFSDSLALSHLTGELPKYFDFFSRFKQAKLEFRTKSANIKELKKLAPLPNVITTFSLSPGDKIKKNDLKTPPLKARLNAIKELHQLGHPIGIHFDPIIFDLNVVEKYETLIDELAAVIPLNEVEYLSLGVVRFTKDVFHQVKLNYPESELLSSEMIKSDNNLIRYSRPKRLWLLNQIERLCIEKGFQRDSVYLCMENGTEI